MICLIRFTGIEEKCRLLFTNWWANWILKYVTLTTSATFWGHTFAVITAIGTLWNASTIRFQIIAYITWACIWSRTISFATWWIANWRTEFARFIQSIALFANASIISAFTILTTWIWIGILAIVFSRHLLIIRISISPMGHVGTQKSARFLTWSG